MKLFKHINETIDYRKLLKLKKFSLGFVPTMGALHEGHLTLVRRAKAENQSVAVSIFVNPIQFNKASDLHNYPRTLENDLEMLSGILEPGDFVFAPDAEEMYSVEETKSYDFGDLEKVMEGAHRPGHFNGVGIVVDKLFRIIEPTSAYFGEKDFQQLAIIRELTKIESHPVKIVPCQIIREPDGLAMSSRNKRLLPADRKHADHLYTSLLLAKQEISLGKSPDEISTQLTKQLNAISNFRVEYITFATEEGLVEITRPCNLRVRCFIAVFAGEVRLIDNLPMF
ncbi:MAG: pantoate--beta-alanine ligase [Bacteroidota bacterium]|nr:pantoate--beta-alanine ligase [Bacteroidota bacterium]